MSELKPASFLSHLLSILILPFTVLIIIPLIIYTSTDEQSFIDTLSKFNILLNLVGFCFLCMGIVLFISTLYLFHHQGKGTLAPWNPPKRLVIKGPYRYVRNPMIVGVNAILLAEAFLIPSGNILIWQVFFFLSNHFYFILKEEPDLVKRFGSDYVDYMKNVPRWRPRLTPWFNREQ